MTIGFGIHSREKDNDRGIEFAFMLSYSHLRIIKKDSTFLQINFRPKFQAYIQYPFRKKIGVKYKTLFGI